MAVAPPPWILALVASMGTHLEKVKVSFCSVNTNCTYIRLYKLVYYIHVHMYVYMCKPIVEQPKFIIWDLPVTCTFIKVRSLEDDLPMTVLPYRLHDSAARI